jgi:rubrerythrin
MGNKGLLEAIQLAIQAERAAQQFYRDAAAKTVNPQGKAFLLELAGFEAYHEEKLLALVDSLSASKYFKYEGRELVLPKSEGGVRVRKEPHPQEMAGILGMAMDAEKKAQERYKALAEGTADPAGKAMFERLAQEEAVHNRILSDEFYTLSNKGRWV